MADLRRVMPLTVELQLESRDLARVGEEGLYGRYSYGRYGAKVGAGRLLQCFENLGVHATFFVPASDALRHPGVLEAILEGGHEVAAHGWGRDRHATSLDEERQRLMQVKDTLVHLTGVSMPGWRAPEDSMTEHSLALLGECGFFYDSSYQDDDIPYLHGMAAGQRLPELPVSEVLKDETFYGHTATQDCLLSAWEDEFQALLQENRGFPCLTVSPRGDVGLSRPSGIVALTRFLTRVMDAGVSVSRCDEMTRQMLAEPASMPVFQPFNPPADRERPWRPTASQ